MFICVHLCSTCAHLCSFVFHLCSLVSICVPLVFHLCGVLDQVGKETKKIGWTIIVTLRFGRCLEYFSFFFYLRICFALGLLGLLGSCEGI